VPVTQHFPDRALPDVAGTVVRELASSELAAKLRPGMRVAVSAGSRGISNLAQITRAAVSFLRERGCEPFVFPAMGSHGGGTPEGQREVLAKYGITEPGVGCPIVSSLETVGLGQTPEGIDVRVDRAAWEADAVLLINRVKWHTTFDAPIESGLVKMAAIGIGKLYGAQEYHRNIVRLGFEQVICSVGRHVLATGKIAGGVAILEDAHHQTCEIRAIPAERIEKVEAELLAGAKAGMPRLLFPEIDILIVDEIGKHISGVGMDSKVINRHPYGTPNPWSYLPRILRIYVRNLSPKSYGNANGFGMADMISERLYEALDWEATKVNALTACNFPSIRTPLRAKTDAEALRILSAAVGRREPSEVTCVWIQNTLELTHILATQNLLADAPPDVECTGSPVDWEWDTSGNLPAFHEVLAATQSAVAGQR
jgi:hypothetical protein